MSLLLTMSESCTELPSGRACVTAILVDGHIGESVGFLYNIPVRFSLSRTSIVSAASRTRVDPVVDRQVICSLMTSAESSVAFDLSSFQAEKNVRRRDKHWNLLWRSWSEALWYSDANQSFRLSES